MRSRLSRHLMLLCKSFFGRETTRASKVRPSGFCGKSGLLMTWKSGSLTSNTWDRMTLVDIYYFHDMTNPGDSYLGRLRPQWRNHAEGWVPDGCPRTDSRPLAPTPAFNYILSIRSPIVLSRLSPSCYKNYGVGPFLIVEVALRIHVSM